MRRVVLGCVAGMLGCLFMSAVLRECGKQQDFATARGPVASVRQGEGYDLPSGGEGAVRAETAMRESRNTTLAASEIAATITAAGECEAALVPGARPGGCLQYFGGAERLSNHRSEPSADSADRRLSGSSGAPILAATAAHARNAREEMAPVAAYAGEDEYRVVKVWPVRLPGGGVAMWPAPHRVRRVRDGAEFDVDDTGKWTARRTVRLRLSAADQVIAARIAANEDSRPLRRTPSGTDGEPTADTLAILQVVHDFAAWKDITPAAALRRLAPYVSGERTAKKRRHAVSVSLPAVGMAQPVLWLDGEGGDGDWSVHGPLWAKFRDAVRHLVRDGFEALCPRAVITWGGDMDDHIAEARGLERVDCGGDTVNSFWALPAKRSGAKTMDAATAAGKKGL